MKKRAVLFLLVLCAMLCLVTPAMAKTSIVDKDDANNVKVKYTQANESNDTIELVRNLRDIDMSGSDWVLQTQMLLTSERTYTTKDSSKLTIGKDGTLATKGDAIAVFKSDIINYGTIESGIYTGTITNYGTITGGTFWGTVINATDGTNTGSVPADDKQSADLSQAKLMVKNAAGTESNGENDSSFAGAYIEVTLKLEGDEHIDGNPSSPLKIMRGTSIWPSKPTRDGDPATTSTVFAYWRKEGTNSFYSHDNLYFTGSQITLTPVWCDHVVILNVNKPADSQLVSKNMLPVAFYKSESSQVLSTNRYVCFREGVSKNERANFLCWNTREDGKGLSYSEDNGSGNKLAYTAKFDPIEPQTTLYARWVVSKVTDDSITYIYQRDEKGTKREREDKKENLICYELKSNMFTPVRGQKFMGWHVQNIDEPNLLQPGDTILITQLGDTPPIGANPDLIHITAQWQPLPVTEITFDANGTGVTGTTGTGNKEIYYEGETLPLPTNGFTRSGCTFAGWNTQSDGTGTPYTDEQKISITGELAGDGTQTKKVTLYAQWRALPILINQQPEDQSVMEGQPARFATNGFAPFPTTLSYQWYVDKGDGNGFVICPGETAATLDIAKTTAAQNGYRYRCVLSKGVTSATTSAALLTVQVLPPPKTGDPANSALWLALCLMSLAGMATLAAVKKRRFSQR